MNPNDGQAVVYVDNEGVEYPARVLSLKEDGTNETELYVTGEQGDWTVLNVPFGKQATGAYWKLLEPLPVNTDAVILTAREPQTPARTQDDQLVAVAKAAPPKKQRKGKN